MEAPYNQMMTLQSTDVLVPLTEKLVKYLIPSFRVLIEPAESLKCVRGLVEAERDPGKSSLLKSNTYLCFFVLDILTATG